MVVSSLRLVNKLIPGYVKKINTKGGNFALMENIAAVQKGMRQYGVPEDELFQPVDLFEARNIKAVVKSLAALARTVISVTAFTLSRTAVISLHFARGPAEAKCILVTAVCLSVCLSVPRRIPTLLHGAGCNLGASSCALGGFKIGARVSLNLI